MFHEESDMDLISEIRKTTVLFFFCFVCLTVSAGGEDSRFAKWPSYLNEMRKTAVKNSAKRTGEDVNNFLQQARKSKLKDVLSWGYYYYVFHYSVVAPEIKKAEAAVRYMEKAEMNEADINLSKFDIIYYYQIIGESAKAVALCRDILNTAHEKDAIAEAQYNIILLYQSLNMYDQAIKKMIELCHFSESITEKRIYHYGLANFYSSVADFLVEKERYKEALSYLMKTDSTMNHDGKDAPSIGNNDMRFVTVTWGKYYLGMNDDKSVWKQIKKLRTYNDNPLMAYSYELESRYYLKHKDFVKAKTTMDEMMRIMKNIGLEYCDTKRTLMKANVYFGLKDYKTACSFYQRFITANDSLNNQADELKTNEYAVKLNLNKADLERSEYKAKADHYRMQLMMLVTAVVLLIFMASVIIIIYLRKINRKLHQTNGRLQKAYERVDNLNRMKVSFIQNMSHEIRTPLNSIVGFSQVLGACNEENKQYADIINENSYFLLKIVGNTLDISDLESCEIKIGPVSVSNCCMEALNMIKERIDEAVKVVYEPSDKELVIESNYLRLKQVIGNLLDNAAKFTQQGSITLSYCVEDSQLYLCVKDTGLGVPADKAEWVFERFAKVNDFVLGSGLGLSICQMIVERLHGTIRIDTEYQSGCKVDVWLPIS